MALLRPRWTGVSRRDLAVAIGGSGGVVDIFNLTDGPGIIWGGGFKVSSLAHAEASYDLKLVIDGETSFDFSLDLLELITGQSLTRPWEFTVSTTFFDFDFVERANLAFQSSVQLELKNNDVSADTIDIVGGLDYHRGV